MSTCEENVYRLVTQLCDLQINGNNSTNRGRIARTEKANKAVKNARKKAFGIFLSQSGDCEFSKFGMSHTEFLIAISYHLRCKRRYADAEILESLAFDISSKNHPDSVKGVLRLFAFLTDIVETKGLTKQNNTFTATRKMEKCNVLPDGPRSYDEDFFPRANFYYTNYPKALFQNLPDPCSFGDDVDSTRSNWIPANLSSNPSKWFTDAFSKTKYIPATLDLCRHLPPLAGELSLTPTSDQFSKRPPSEEDEGFAENYSPSNSATPLSGNCTSVDGIGMEIYSSEKAYLWEQAMKVEYPVYRTWESCGRAYAEREKPLLSESGPRCVYDIVVDKLSTLVMLNPKLRIPLPTEIRHDDLVRDAKFLLVGIQSQNFIFNKVTRAFDIRHGICVEGLSPDSVASFASAFLECGSTAAALSSYISYWKSNREKKSVIFDAFLHGTSTWFQLYVARVLGVNKAKTLLELDLRTAQLRKWINYLRDVCTAVVRLIDKPPVGVSILSFLYDELLENIDSDLKPIVSSLFVGCCQPFLKYVQKWVFQGECTDTYGEFGIAVDRESLRLRDRRFWTKAYSFWANDGQQSFPRFLKCISADILSCGKTLNLLQVCSAEHPLTRPKVKAPELGITFAKGGFAGDEKSWEFYSDSLKEQLGEHCTPYKQKLLEREDVAMATLKLAEKTRSDWMAELQRKVEAKRNAIEKLKRRNWAELVAQMDAVREMKKMKYEQKFSIPTIPEARVEECEVEKMEESPDSPGEDRQILDDKNERDAEETLNNRAEITDSKITNYYNMNQPGAVGLDPNANLDNESNVRNANLILRNENLNFNETANEECGAKASGKRKNKNKLLKKKADQCFQQLENIAGPTVNEVRIEETLAEVEQEWMTNGKSADQDGSNGDQRVDIYDCNTKVLLRQRGRNIHGHASDSSIENLLYANCAKNVDPPQTSETNHLTIGQVPKLSGEMKIVATELEAVAYKQYLTEFDDVRDVVNKAYEYVDSDAIDLPVQIMLEKCLLNPLGYQIFLVNSGIVDYLMVEENMNAHFNALRDYFFFQDGEFGQSLCDMLFKKIITCRHPSQLLNPVVLNSVLSHSISLSINGETEYSGNLSLVVKNTPIAFPANDIASLDCLGLSYKPKWPINVIITQSGLEKYNNVFSFMLQVKRACWSLTNIFHILKYTEKKFRTNSSFHYRQLQIFRHGMHHFVRVLQDYICSQVLQVTWQEFQKELAGSVRNLDDLHEIHARFLGKACSRCLLNKKAATVMKIIHNCLNAILKFNTLLEEAEWMLNVNTSEMETTSYSRLFAAYKGFAESSEFLYSVMEKLQGRGYLQLLEEFLLRLDLNKSYFRQAVY